MCNPYKTYYYEKDERSYIVFLLHFLCKQIMSTNLGTLKIYFLILGGKKALDSSIGTPQCTHVRTYVRYVMFQGVLIEVDRY